MPKKIKETLFLDANILFSAAYREDAGIQKLWELPHTQLISSAYAVEEARRNLKLPEQKKRLEKFIMLLNFISIHLSKTVTLPNNIELREKDRPILLAAISAKADYLITGDCRDFGCYFGKTIAGVTILPPAEYLKKRKK